MNETLIRLNKHWSEGKYAALQPRDLLQTLLRKQEMPHIHVLTGVRRSGKSTLFRLLINELTDAGVDPRRILVLNMDEPIFTPLWNNPAGIYGVIEQAEVLTGTKTAYLFLDEIQQVKGWEFFVKGAYDTSRFRKIYVTGSTADLLQRQFATLLSGRYLADVVRPLSFSELLGVHGITDTLSLGVRKAEALRLLNQYLVYGGFPEIDLGALPDDLKIELLQSYYESIVLKDCIAYNQVRDTAAFYRTIYYLLANPTAVFRYSSLGKALGNSENTVKKYLDYAVGAYVFSDVTNFSFSTKESTRPEHKAYCTDNGLISAVGYRFSPNHGRLLENAVYNQLLIAGYTDIAFVRKDGGECDFVARRHGDYHAFQVCHELSDANRTRETGGFDLPDPRLQIVSQTVVTYNSEEQSGRVRVVPFHTWALEG